MYWQVDGYCHVFGGEDECLRTVEDILNGGIGGTLHAQSGGNKALDDILIFHKYIKLYRIADLLLLYIYFTTA